MRQAINNQTITTNARIKSLRTTPDPTTYCQVVRPVTFQHDDPTFYPTALSVGGDVPSHPDSIGAAQAAPELTKKAGAAPESATPIFLRGGNRIFKLAPPTGVKDQEFPPTSTVTSRWWGVLAQKMMILFTLGRSKIYPQLKIPL